MVMGPKLTEKAFALLWMGALFFSLYILYCAIYIMVKNRKKHKDLAIAVITIILLLYFYYLQFTF